MFQTGPLAAGTLQKTAYMYGFDRDTLVGWRKKTKKAKGEMTTSIEADGGDGDPVYLVFHDEKRAHESLTVSEYKVLKAKKEAADRKAKKDVADDPWKMEAKKPDGTKVWFILSKLSTTRYGFIMKERREIAGAKDSPEAQLTIDTDNQDPALFGEDARVRELHEFMKVLFVF